MPRMNQRLIWGALAGCLVLASIPASAQSLSTMTAKTPPVKKTRNGFCIPPGTAAYPQIKIFTPFQAMKDCVKSGGRPAKS